MEHSFTWKAHDKISSVVICEFNDPKGFSIIVGGVNTRPDTDRIDQKVSLLKYDVKTKKFSVSGFSDSLEQAKFKVEQRYLLKYNRAYHGLPHPTKS